MEGRIKLYGVTCILHNPEAGWAAPGLSWADVRLLHICDSGSEDGDSILGRLTKMPPFPRGYHRSVTRQETGVLATSIHAGDESRALLGTEAGFAEFPHDPRPAS